MIKSISDLRVQCVPSGSIHKWSAGVITVSWLGRENTHTLRFHTVAARELSWACSATLSRECRMEQDGPYLWLTPLSAQTGHSSEGNYVIVLRGDWTFRTYRAPVRADSSTPDEAIFHPAPRKAGQHRWECIVRVIAHFSPFSPLTTCFIANKLLSITLFLRNFNSMHPQPMSKVGICFRSVKR